MEFGVKLFNGESGVLPKTTGRVGQRVAKRQTFITFSYRAAEVPKVHNFYILFTQDPFVMDIHIKTILAVFILLLILLTLLKCLLVLFKVLYK